MKRALAARCLPLAFGAALYITAVPGATAEQCDFITLSGTGQVDPGTLVITGRETLRVDGLVKADLEFTAVPLGILNVDLSENRTTTSVYSHEFKSVGSGRLAFTTIDDIKIIPLPSPESEDPDERCQANACGLVFRLKLLEGRGQYNCGEIVSGLKPVFDPTQEVTPANFPFTSYSAGGDVVLNSHGKLCKCSGNN